MSPWNTILLVSANLVFRGRLSGTDEKFRPRDVVILFAVLSPVAAITAAVAAVGAPLLLHLLFRKRYQIIPWAAIRFLLVAERRHRRRIDHWLLLALRILALLLPLMGMIAITEPAESLWQRLRPGQPLLVSSGPRTHHVLVVDISLSMTARTEDGRTRFEHAIDQAEQLVRNANSGDGFTLIALGATPETVIEGPSNEPEKVIAELKRLRVTHGPADAAAVIAQRAEPISDAEIPRTVADVLGRSPRSYPRRQVTVFSDLQRATWASVLPTQPISNSTEDARLREAWRKLLDDGKVDLVVVDLARFDVENMALVDLSLIDPLPLTDTPVVVQATVQNFGRIERRRVAVELLMARPSASGIETLIRVDSIKTIDVLPAGGRASVTFVLDGVHRFRDRGIHVLQASLVKDPFNPRDDLPADDSRAMALDVREGLHTVMIDGRPSLDPERRGSSYVSWALHPPGLSLNETPARLFRPGTRPPESPEDRWVLTPGQASHPTQGEIAGADCVFLCDIPNPTLALVARLEAHLKRGGGVVIGLGPNAAASRDTYNRLLFNEGKGILPGELGDVVAVNPLPNPATNAVATPGFLLSANDEAMRQPPLTVFQSDNARAGLFSVPFHGYIRLDAPQEGKARRILSFVPALELPNGTPDWARRAVLFSLGYPLGVPDPAVVEWTFMRGRVIVYCSTFHPDIEWTRWPLLPTYLPFVHQLLRFASSNPDRHTLRVGDPIDEYFSSTLADTSFFVTGPDGLTLSQPLVVQDESLVAHYADTRLSGIYRLGVGANRDRAFAVNIPENASFGGSESDLSRIDLQEFRSLGSIQIVKSPLEVKSIHGDDDSLMVSKPRPWGSDVARVFMFLALTVIMLELFVAWWIGPSRNTASRHSLQPNRRWGIWSSVTAIGFLPVLLTASILFVLIHAEMTGNLIGFVPESSREELRIKMGGVANDPGEGIAWRLEWFTALIHPGTLERVGLPDRDGIYDAGCRIACGLICCVVVCVLYWCDRHSAGGWVRLLPAALLHIGACGLLLGVLLPQLQLTFDRESWPEVVIVLDTSASMATVDEFRDPEVRSRAGELASRFPFPRAEQTRDATTRFQLNRLELSQSVVFGGERDWFDRLTSDKRVKVTVYAVDRDTRRIVTVLESEDRTGARRSIGALTPRGDQSRLGDGVEEVLRRHQGRSLAGIIYFTDGVTTAGSEWPSAARKAAQAGVPLHIVGTGDVWEAPDLMLADLQVEDVVTRGDNLVFAARLSARGQVPAEPVAVILCEKRDNPTEEPQRVGDPGVLAQALVAPDLSGNPVTVRLSHTPMTMGETTYVLKVVPVPDEATLTNNRVERTILVTEARKTRVLYIEGRPRFDFRFAKVLLEREQERTASNNLFEVQVLLLGATPGWTQTDRSALPAFPTREQLFDYDVIILGDVDRGMIERQFSSESDPRARTANALRDLSDFVRVRGGGLLILAGEHAGANGFIDTPLAEILPIIPTEPNAKTTTDDRPITETYRLRLTPAGIRHPMFRLHTDEAESSQIWARLPALYWYAKGYKRKPASEVLAIHPDRAAEAPGPSGRPENHPLALQQFVGNGRVIFLGFDDLWRWRFRANEEYFNRFWLQGIRVLSRSKIGRIELRTDKQTPYREGDRMVITVRFPDDAPPPPEGQIVQIRWLRSRLAGPGAYTGQGETSDELLMLTRSQSTDGNRKPEDARTFQHVLTRTPIGDYRFVLMEPNLEGNRPKAEARVLPPPDERTRVELNKSELISAASISGGRFYSLAEADAVLDELKNLDPVPLDQPRPPMTLWDQPGIYALFFSMLLIEWLFRKRERLV